MLAFPYFSPVSIQPSIARTFIIRGKRPAVAGSRRQRDRLPETVLPVPSPADRFCAGSVTERTIGGRYRP